MSQEANGARRLVDALRPVGGLEVRLGAPLAPLTTLRIGGAAELLVEVADEAALRDLVRATTRLGVAFQLLGMGSNLLVPDAGLGGVTATLVGAFRQSEIDGETVRAGSGASLAQLARRLARQGRPGLEAFSGFPSTVGGAVVMNAGCYGVEIKDVLVSVRTVTHDGERKLYLPDDLKPGYRSTVLQDRDEVVTEAVFRIGSGDAAASLARIDELNRKRRSSLPSGFPNAGSVFRNPDGDFAGRLIESVGLKGERRGQAQISEKHANVIVNRGGARADDVLDLMTTAYRRVFERTAVRLQPEVVLTGDLRQRWIAATEEIDG